MKGVYIAVRKSERKVRQPFHWQMLAANGRIIAHGETHPTRAKAIRAAENVIRSTVSMLFDARAPHITRTTENGVTRIVWQ